MARFRRSNGGRKSPAPAGKSRWLLSFSAVSGLTSVRDGGGSGIDISDSRGTFTFTNTDIDGLAGSGVRLNNNPDAASFTFNGGRIDGTAMDGFNVVDSNNVSINGFLFSDLNSVAGDDMDYS